MKFYKHLLIGRSIKNPRKVKRKLKAYSPQNLYVILPASGGGQLEIMHSAFLLQKYYRRHKPVIIGIAGDYEEAVRLILDLTRECLENTGGCDLKEYLKQKAKKPE